MEAGSGSRKGPLERDGREAVVRGAQGTEMWADWEAEGQAGDGPGQTGSLGPASPRPCPFRSATFPNCPSVPVRTAGTTVLCDFQKSLPISPPISL